MVDGGQTVLAVFHDAGLAGAELVTLGHLRALRARGARVVAVLPRAGALVGALRGVADAVHFHAAPWWIRLTGSRTHGRGWDATSRSGLGLRLDRSVAALGRVIAAEKPAVVVSSASVVLSPALAARQAGIAAVQFVHEWPGGGLMGAGERGAAAGWDSSLPWAESLALLRNVNHRLIWSSPACAVAWGAGGAGGFGGMDDGAIAAAWQQRQAQGDTEQFLPHAVDVAAYSPRKQMAGEVLRLVHVATWSERKGTDRMVAILAGLHARGVAFTATLVGRQPRDRFARGIAQQLARAPFADRVTVKAYAQDLPGLLAANDVLVHPAREDTSPLILAHALAAGLPVVASDLPGIHEMLTGYRPGATPCGNLLSATEIAPWVALLAEPAGKLKRHWAQGAQAAQRLVRETFNAEAVEARFVEILAAAQEAARRTTAEEFRLMAGGAGAALGGGRGRSAGARLWAARDAAADAGRGVLARLRGR